MTKETNKLEEALTEELIRKNPDDAAYALRAVVRIIQDFEDREQAAGSCGLEPWEYTAPYCSIMQELEDFAEETTENEELPCG